MASSGADQARPETGKEKRGVMRLSVSSLVSLIFLAFVAIGMAYIGGVMSGRHAGPGQEATRVIAPAPQPVEEEETAKSGILSPEELEFARVLRNTPAPKDNAAPAAIKERAAPESVGDASGENGQNSRVFQEAGLEPPAPEGMNDYVFQMGAFRDEAGADRLREILEGHGLRTRMRRSGKIFLVLALVRGDAQRAAEIITLARNLRLGSPLELERKPVPPRNR